MNHNVIPGKEVTDQDIEDVSRSLKEIADQDKSWIEKSDDTIKEGLKVDKDDGLALATVKRTGAVTLGGITGTVDFATDTLEGLYHLADNSANYLWGNAVGAVDFLTDHTLSDNFEYVQNINIQTN
ncbi:hypothetical protein [Wohlfahrtiimonas populi]|uniref:hypothetical protein n=1 Tax=Wohlfahrtiimonas populi TaxID=1940240 RepID=UPI00098D2F40|nr:hypothetical protein [Wohlfahrtiimonas populi]